MVRLIDADALTKEIKQDIADDGLTERYVFYRINSAPTIDIVRCRECSKHNTHRCHMAFDLIATEDDDFCSYGCRSEKPSNSND